jgi:hypothetical protein
MHVLGLIGYMPSEFLCDMPYADAIFSEYAICQQHICQNTEDCVRTLVLKEILAREPCFKSGRVTCLLDAAAFTAFWQPGTPKSVAARI